jgi:hypothetical protein
MDTRPVVKAMAMAMAIASKVPSQDCVGRMENGRLARGRESHKHSGAFRKSYG